MQTSSPAPPAVTVALVGVLLLVLVVLRSGASIAAAPDTSTATVAVIDLVVLLVLLAGSVVLTRIDLHEQRLPDAVVLPAYPLVVVLLTVRSVVGGDWAALARAGAGLVVLGGVYLLLAVAVPGGMGAGDVKLAGVLGLVLAHSGWASLVVGASGAFLLGGGFAVGLLLVRRVQRGSGFPFGPWMLAGAWVGILVGQPVIDGLVRLTGLT